MRFMLISDIHGSMKAAESAGKEAKERGVDIMLVAGDITHFGRADEAERIFSMFPVRTVAVPGNCDPPDILPSHEKIMDVHGKRVEYRGICFAGLGASNLTSFSTLFTYGEENIYLILDSIMKDCDVMVTHTPPMGILDKTAFGHRGGSESIRKVAEEQRPPLHVFGHIHESPGVEMHNGTVFVNAGPARNGNAAIIDVEKKNGKLKVPDVELIRLFSG